ncbi:TPA: hypothetical protein ACJMDV_000950 [Neisseria meningitidis]
MLQPTNSTNHTKSTNVTKSINPAYSVNSNHVRRFADTRRFRRKPLQGWRHRWAEAHPTTTLRIAGFPPARE